MKHVIVIPTYKEHDTLHHLIPKLEKMAWVHNVLLVDDTKDFETREFQSDKVLCIPRTDKKRGYGKSLKLGLVLARNVLNADFIIQMDADHNPKDIEHFFKNQDLVIGYEPKHGIIGKTSRLLSKYLLGLNFKHPTCGFRNWRGSIIDSIEWRKVKSKGFDIQIELLYMAKRMNCSIQEVSIDFNDRKYDRSKLGLRQIIRWFMMLRRMVSKHLYITFINIITAKR